MDLNSAYLKSSAAVSPVVFVEAEDSACKTERGLSRSSNTVLNILVVRLIRLSFVEFSTATNHVS